MKKWKEILADRSTYPDDFTISLKDGSTVTLAQMRAEDAETEGALTAKLTAREQDLATRESQLGKASKGVMEMFENYLNLTGLTAEEALAGKKPTVKAAAAATGLDENDPLLGEMVKTVKGLQSELAATKAELINQRDKVLKPVLSTYLNDYYQDRWEDKIEPGLPKAAKGKVTFDQVMKHAEDNGYKDKQGRLNLLKAASDLTADYSTQEWRETEREKIRKEVENELTMAASQRPGAPGARPTVAKNFLDDKGHTKTFDQVLQDAAADTDLWQGIAKGA